jgi:probable HAF family extracellular repeat protein
MKAWKRIVALAARASPGGRVLALLLALFVAAGVVILVGAAVPSEAQTASTAYTVKDLGTIPGGIYSAARGINDSGQVVGQSNLGQELHAFLYSNGHMQDLGTLPGGDFSEANGINDSGQVVGHAITPSGEAHAFLYSNGQMQDLNSLIPAGSGWIVEGDWGGINTSGQIVGTGVINGEVRAFLATPGTPPSDTPAPTVTSTVPRANAKGVAPTINVKATFSEDMQSASVKNAFKLFKKGSTIQLAAVVSYNAATDKATLNPTNNLKRGATYKALVTTVAKDMAGNRLDQDGTTSGLQQKVWYFTVDD